MKRARTYSSAFVSRMLCAAFVCVIAVTATAFADGIPGRNDENPNPPYATGVLMANGIYNPFDPSFVPPTPDEFDTVIMGRSETEKQERRQLAIDYFIERYGVDLSFGFADGGNIVLLESLMDPRSNYRAYSLPAAAGGTSKTPPEGRIVYDRQYVMFVGALGLDSTLTGSWGGPSGTVVPPNTVAVDGEYLIQGTRQFKQGHPGNLYVRFQSVDPIFNADSGDIKFNCVLLDDDGNIVGAAIGRQELVPLDDGSGFFQVAIQNVWQFPAPEWALP